VTTTAVPTRLPSSRRAEVAVLVAIAFATVVAVRLLPRPVTGLSGQYWNTVESSGAPFAESHGALPTTADYLRHLPAATHRAGSAEWTGVLVVERPGVQRFDLVSDDAAWLYVGDRLVVDNGGTHGALRATGSVNLYAGFHQIRVRYVQSGGDLLLDLWWAAPGETLRPLGAGDLAPSRAAARRQAWAPLIRAVAVAIPVTWACLLLYLPVRLAAHWTWRAVRAAEPRAGVRQALAGLLLLAAGLLAWGIGWGIAGDQWAADELNPGLVAWGLDARFSGGWHDKYPVMHYAVLAVPALAFRLADALGVLPIASLDAWTAQLLLMRDISVLLGLGALVAALLCCTELGIAHPVLGAAALLLTPGFVYYGKLANLDVPALCWFGVAVLSLLRLLRRDRLRDYVVLGTASAAAVATKDQFYANLALVPLVVLVTVVRRQAPGPAWHRLGRSVVDRRWLAAGAAAAAASVVLHNVVLNPGGFAAHVRTLYTFPSLAIVSRDAAGYVALTTRSIDLFRFALGWPLFLAALAGIAGAVARPARRWWLWLLVVPVSFHLTFTWVALYVNDRYLFGGVFVLALFAGAAMSDLLTATRHRGAARLVVAGALVWSLLHAASIDAMMGRDSREAARRWVYAHAGPGTVVGTLGWYVPHFEPPVRALAIDDRAELDRVAPRFVVVNERFGGRYDVARPGGPGEVIAGLRDGSARYREVYRHRSAVPGWAVLQRQAAFASGPGSDLTNLDKVNPEVVIYRRETP
jgi:hypothetical protein